MIDLPALIRRGFCALSGDVYFYTFIVDVYKKTR